MLAASRECRNEANVEVVLSSAMLLNVLNFPDSDLVDDAKRNTSWITGSHETLSGWLALQSGMKPLIQSLTAHIVETRIIIGQTMFGSEQGQWPTPDFAFKPKHLPDVWIEALDLNAPFSREVFGQSAMILKELEDVKPLSLNVLKNLLFVWKMSPQFRLLLSQREERAMWMFGYWLGLMRRYQGVWWCYKRVTREYEAVYNVLDQLRLPERPDPKGQSWLVMMKQLQLAPCRIAEPCSTLSGVINALAPAG